MPEAAPGRRLGSCIRKLLLALTLAASGALAQDAQDGGAGRPDVPPGPVPAPGADEPEPAVPYRVAIEGELTAALRSLLEQVSETRRLVDEPPASEVRLRRRAEADIPRLQQALRSRGYYDAEVDLRIESEATPARVVFEVERGPLYQLETVEIETGGEVPPGLDLPDRRALGLPEGAPAAARPIIDAQAELLRRIKGQGFALAEAGDRRVVVDHDRRTMDVTFRLEPGPQARFGPLTIEGLDDVERELVLRRIGWREGELVTPARLEEARRSLIDTGLFRGVAIELEEEPDPEARLPVTVRVTERKHRSVGIGVRYRSDEGPGGNVFLEHRNLFGQGESGEIEVDASGVGFRLGGAFRKPDFLRLDQALIAETEAALEDTDAFESTSIGASAGVERTFTEDLVGSLSLAFRYVEIDDKADDRGDETFGLLSLPGRLAWDFSDDLLDPSSGGRLTIEEEPFVDVMGAGIAFNKALVQHTHYVQLLDDPRLIFAGRAAVGSIVGAEREDIPADERFFAGGGGSVRGFGFQKAGELDAEGDPIGGRSLLELAAEFRLNFTDTIGAVAFLDAGAAFEAMLPDFSEELRLGTGVGLRYFSPIGPIRFDVGFPINRRDSDDAFQIYISLGQAF